MLQLCDLKKLLQRFWAKESLLRGNILGRRREEGTLKRTERESGRKKTKEKEKKPGR